MRSAFLVGSFCLSPKCRYAGGCHPPFSDQSIDAAAISLGCCPGGAAGREALQVRVFVTPASRAFAPAETQSLVKHFQKCDARNLRSGLVDAEPHPSRGGVMQFKPSPQVGGTIERQNGEIRSRRHRIRSIRVEFKLGSGAQKDVLHTNFAPQRGPCRRESRHSYGNAGDTSRG
jgi:hypothetical protein